MALFLDGPLPLEDVLVYTQAVPLPSNTNLQQMFPRREFSTDEIDFAVITQTNRFAQFRNWDGNYWTSPRDSGLEKRIRLLPLGGKLGVGEYERRQMQFSQVNGSIQNILIPAIYNDLTKLTQYVYNRLEMAWGDVLTDGVLTINENGVQQSLDFGIPSNQKVTAGTLWSDTVNSDPLADMIAWYDVWVAINGAPPGKAVLSLATARQLQTNAKLIAAYSTQSTQARTHITLAQISEILQNYNLPPISMDNVYNSFFQNDAGSSVRPIPANKFLWLPEDLNELGFTAWGTPTTVMEMIDVDVQVESGAGVIGMLVKADNPPFQKTTYVDAVAMPVLADPRKVLVATVA